MAADEFALLQENIDEYGLDIAVPSVRREQLATRDGRHIGALVWGEGAPAYVFLHGLAQNAHTFDTVLLALGQPALALDLPGHGHSSGGPHALTVDELAHDVASALRSRLTAPVTFVGMSLGGLIALEVAATLPQLVERLVLLDITPGVTAEAARHVTDFVEGPASFDSFDELLARTVAHHPTRSVASLRRGILHNARQREDGTWIWRYREHGPLPRANFDAAALWDIVASIPQPITLLYGTGTGSVVRVQDRAELQRRRADATSIAVDGAGHSLQGDAPLAVARLLRDAGGEGLEPSTSGTKIRRSAN